ncbi:MAG: hypothetical protein V4657_03805 [Pseudomonadota bacterium]
MTDSGHPVPDGLSSDDGAASVSTLRASIPDAVAEIRMNADALAKWFDSVSDEQREAMGFMGGGYGIENAARDALDCAFRLAQSSVHAMKTVADALEALAKAIEARSGQTEGLDPKGESAVAESHLPETPEN